MLTFIICFGLGIVFAITGLVNYNKLVEQGNVGTFWTIIVIAGLMFIAGMQF